MQISFNFIPEWFSKVLSIARIIKKDLKELLIRDGVKNYSEIVGNRIHIIILINLTLSRISPYIGNIIMSKKCELTGKIPNERSQC